MADHYVDVVNEKDEVIGKEMKHKKPELGFISRFVAVLIQDSAGRIIVCKRNPHKKFDPDKYDLTAFGSVDAGEDYSAAAARELTEETGLSCPLTMLGKLYQENHHGDKTFRLFSGIFLGETDADPQLSHETVLFRRMTVAEIEKELAENPDAFCKGFRNDFNFVKNKLAHEEK